MIQADATYLAKHNTASRTPVYSISISAPLGYDDGLAAGWELDESSGTREDTGSNNLDLSPTNTPGSTTGKVGDALDLVAASSQYLSRSVTSSDALYMGDVVFTVTAWVMLDTKPANAMFIASQLGTLTNRSWALLWDNATDRFMFATNDGAGTQATVTSDTFGAPSTGVWYFVAAWRTSSAIYISINDGSSNSTSTTLIPGAVTEDFRVGAAATSGSPGTFWDGKIDQVYIWRRALSAADKTYIYNSGSGRSIATAITTPPTGLQCCTANSSFHGQDLGDEILTPISLDKRVDPEQCRFPLFTLVCDIYNHTESAINAFADDLVGYKVDFYMGFYDVAWSHAVQMFSGFITEIEYRPGCFRITARSMMAKALGAKIFNGAASTLASAITNSSTTLTLVDASKFDPAQDTPQSKRRHVLVNQQEIITYRGRTSTTLTSCIRVTTAFPFWVPPAFPGSESTGHAASSPVLELPDLGNLTGSNDETIGSNDMHPINDYLIDVLTSSDNKRAIGDYGIEVNTASLTTAYGQVGASLRFRFLIREPVNAKKFVEEEIFLPIAAYPVEDNQGRIGMKLYRSASEFAPVGDIDDAHCIDIPKYVGNAEKLINSVTYHYDENPFAQGDNRFANQFTNEDGVLLASHGRPLPLIIKARGVRSPFTGNGLQWFNLTPAFLTSASARHLSRFGTRAPIYRCRTVFNRNLLEVGDDVQSTFVQVVDLDGGTTSLTSGKSEIIAMRHDFRQGVIDIDLLAYPS